MAANILNSAGFLEKTATELELIRASGAPEDMQTDDIPDELEDSLLSEGNDNEDEIPSAQILKQRLTSTERQRPEQPRERPERPSTSSHRQNDAGRKRHRDQDKSAKTNGSSGAKRSRQDEELDSIQEKINSSNNFIGFLENHLAKGTCPKTLRYNVRANITPDEDFKSDIGSIRKKAEQALVGALVKFHHRRIERLSSKFRKLEQAKSRKSNVVNNQSSKRKQPPKASEKIVQHENVDELASVILDKISDKLLERFRSESKIKESEVYPVVLTDPLVIREEGIEKKQNNKAAKNRKRKDRRKDQNKKRFRNAIESRKEHIKNLSNTHLTDEQITLLSRGFKFIPVPVTRENLIRRQLLADFDQFARRMRLQYIFYGQEKEPHPFHVKSDWDPPVQPSVALETFLEEVRFELATIDIEKPKDNLSHGERCALKEHSCDKNIIFKKADKGTTTVIMNREHKIHEGQILLDDVNNYRPLEKPMADTTAKKVQQVIKSLLQEGHIDDMTAKWLSLMPNPPRIPVFYTLTKIHKPTPVGKPIISGCDGPTERISAFVDHLLQPIAQIQPSYLKDTTDFINFIEKTKLPSNTILVSMDVTSLYTNIPQEEGINTVCEAYEEFYQENPPIPTRYLREMLSLILKENSFQFNGKDYLQSHGTAMGTRMAVAFANIFMAKVEREIMRQSNTTPIFWKRFIDDIISVWDTSRDKIEEFLLKANSSHPTIKFTAEISEAETTFLDTIVYKGDRFLKESILDVRTHFKPTETFQYTNFHSCHPPGVTKGFIKGEALRLLRTNSSQLTFEENVSNFAARLKKRGYPAATVEKHLSEVKFSERKTSLLNRNRTAQKKILPFVTQYHPALPNLKEILMGKWHLIQNQPQLRNIFKEPPLLSYRKGKSLKDILVKAKL